MKTAIQIEDVLQKENKLKEINKKKKDYLCGPVEEVTVPPPIGDTIVKGFSKTSLEGSIKYIDSSELTGLYEIVGQDIGKMVDKKNAAYGDAFHRAEKILKVLYPDGIKPNQYQDLLGITRVIDKLFRLASGNKKAFEENPWRDIAGYGLLGCIYDEE